MIFNKKRDAMSEMTRMTDEGSGWNKALAVGLFLCVTGAAFITSHAMADAEDTARNVVHLSMSAVRTISNEEIAVTVATEKRGPDPAELARQANTDISWARERIAKFPSIVVSAGSYNTSPLYSGNNQATPTWQLVQEIVLKSSTLDDVTSVLGELQSRMQIRSTRFSVSETTRRKVENELIEEAMKAFRERATVVGRQMPSSNYDIGRINIISGFAQPRYPMQMRAMAETAVASTMPAPQLDTGQSEIRMTVEGSVIYR